MPVRTCAGCRRQAEKRELIRIVMTDQGATVDLSGTMTGRGTYLCPSDGCLTEALRKNAIARSLKVKKADTVNGFKEAL